MVRLVLCFLLAGSLHAFSQENKFDLLLKTGTVTPEPNIESIVRDAAPLQSTVANGKYHVIIQFNRIPDDAALRSLKENGVVLIDYLPRLSYTALIPSNFNFKVLPGLDARSVIPMDLSFKAEPQLLSGAPPEWAVAKDGRVEVNVVLFEEQKIIQPLSFLEGMDATVLDVQPQFRTVRLRIAQQDISRMILSPLVQWVEPVTPQPVDDNLPGKTLHRSATLNDGPLNLTGSGVRIGIWDGGQVGPHNDFAGRLTIVENVASDDHASHVAGTMSGAGLLDPVARGMAPGSSVYSYDYNGAVSTEVANAISTYAIVMTQNSWGYGNAFVNCTNRDPYSSESRSQDLNITGNPHFVHVHSAGNSQSVCSGGWGTTTGKAAKNTIVVANVTSAEAISSSSSFGPLADGRLKPEISGMGTSVYSTTPNNTYTGGYSGTSMATPGISGTIAQVYQRYRQLNANANPPASLMKAVVCNNAKDLGNAGPDYKFGFGRINGLQSVRAIESNRYTVNSVTNGVSQTVVVAVPAGAVRLKALLCWTDPAAAANASPALVNNLNLAVTDLSATVWNPWVLNPSSPGNVATRGIDNLNNIEQVTIDNPVAGNCTLTVTGATVTSGTQQYALTWTVEMPYVEVTFPNGSEKLSPSTAYTILWDEAGVTSNVTVQYSLNNGGSWTNISTTVAAGTGRLSWTTPATFTSTARVKVINGSLTDSSDEAFTILGVPGSLAAAANCSVIGSVNVTWAAVTNATHYDVLQLDTVSGVWNVVASSITSLSSTVSGLSPGVRYWFTVRARNNTNSIIGERAIAKSAVASLSGSIPAQPGAITGATAICALQTGVAYSIAPVATATTYTWSVPSGATITSGQGTTSIVVTYGSSSGSVSVTADNVCGASPARTLAITVTVVGQPVSISGNLAPCRNAAGVSYSISPVAGAIIYSWTVPSGMTLLSGQGSTSILVNIGMQSGAIAVTAFNGTCTGIAQTANVIIAQPPLLPVVTPGGPVSFCPGGSVILSAGSGSMVCSADSLSCNGTVTNSTVGTGTSANTSTGYPAPYGNYYESARHQFLILASELTAAGLRAGAISAVTFTVTNTNNAGVHNGFTLRMGCTTASAITTFQTLTKTVLGPVSYVPVVGSNTHFFTSPFMWDGTSNIILEVCHNNDTGSGTVDYTNNASVRYSTTAFTSVVLDRQDNAGSICGSSTVNATSANRPNMVFSGCGTGSPSLTWSPSAGLSATTGTPVTASPSVTTNYYVTATNATGCTRVSAPQTVTVNNCTVTVTVDAFLEGFFNGTQMKSVLFDLGISPDPNASDSITILLYESGNLLTPSHTAKAMLSKFGQATHTFSPVSGMYYIVLRHRNSLEVWSAAPVSLSGPVASYSFKTSASSAYGNNLRNLGGGFFALYSGDVNSDGVVDMADVAYIESGSASLIYGYSLTDLTGDGFTESADFSLVENNLGRLLLRP